MSIDDREAEDEQTPPRPLSHSERARKGCKGRPITLADGGSWLFPYAVHAKTFDTIRDRMYESMTTRGTVATGDIMISACVLLSINYDLSDDELKALLFPPTKREDLLEVVLACLMGEDDPVRSYSNWVRSSLLANGLVPESIAAEDLPFVLFQLEATNRIVPLGQFAHIELRKNKIAALLNN